MWNWLTNVGECFPHGHFGGSTGERIGSFVAALRALKRLSEFSSNCNRVTDKIALVIIRSIGRKCVK
jgi:hypothetical protein